MRLLGFPPNACLKSIITQKAIFPPSKNLAFWKIRTCDFRVVVTDSSPSVLPLNYPCGFMVALASHQKPVLKTPPDGRVSDLWKMPRPVLSYLLIS